jgi:hypothetical protein
MNYPGKIGKITVTVTQKPNTTPNISDFQVKLCSTTTTGITLINIFDTCLYTLCLHALKIEVI